MPNYSYRCPECSLEFERRLPLAEYNHPQTCDCGATATKLIVMPGFILAGDDWVGKNLKINGQMAERQRRAQKRQDELKRDGPGVSLVPNVDGERVGSWSEAQKLAASKGKNTASFEAKVREEKTK